MQYTGHLLTVTFGFIVLIFLMVRNEHLLIDIVTKYAQSVVFNRFVSKVKPMLLPYSHLFCLFYSLSLINLFYVQPFRRTIAISSCTWYSSYEGKPNHVRISVGK